MKKRRKILIVEDHSLNLKLFRDVLRAKGFETLEDRSGAQCLDLAERHQPELIILDILLPFASGIDLANELRQNPKTAHIPLLGVTALAISGTHNKMIKAGCVECLTKPFTLDQFLKSADNALAYPSRGQRGRVKASGAGKSVSFGVKASTKNAQNQNDLSVSDENKITEKRSTLF